MITESWDHAEVPSTRPNAGWDEEMAEFSLLLSGGEAARLECLAHSHGLTLGRLIRLLIREYLTDRTP
jgi:hypothetical protein